MKRWIALFSLFSVLSLQCAHAATLPFKKVVVIIFENENYSNVLQEQFFGQLAKQGALLTNFMAEKHPSQPNYIALVAGDTLGVTSDSNVDLNVTHIGDLLEHAGKSWKVYAEAYPGGCFTGSRSGTYARKHVPLISFRNVQSDPRRCAQIVDASQFQADVSAGTLPDFSLYVPDLNNDGHDTGVHYADQWFQGAFGLLLQDSKFLQDTLFVVTFDESGISLKNQVYTVLLGSGVVPGSSSGESYSHYNILSTVEQGLGLGNLGRNDAKAPVISGIWR